VPETPRETPDALMRDEANRFGRSSWMASQRVTVFSMMGLAVASSVWRGFLVVGFVALAIAFWCLRRSWQSGVPIVFQYEDDTLEIWWPGGEREHVPSADVSEVSLGRIFGRARYRSAAGESRDFYWFRV
jgi:hypothetical protein